MSRARPLITATMVAHNNGPFIREAIESVIRQELEDWELLVHESGSTEDTWSVIAEMAKDEPRIRAWRADGLVSVPEARNFLLERAQGSFIANIDGDDAWTPRRLSRQIEFMESVEGASCGVCGANCLLMDGTGAVIGEKLFPATHEECALSLWRRNPFCHSATLIRRSCFDRHGLFDLRFEVAEDLELWFRLARSVRFRNLPERLVRYRVSRFGATARRHRAMIRRTLQARRMTWTEYGHRFELGAGLAYTATWCIGWLPPRIVHWLFRNFVLPKSPGTGAAEAESRGLPQSEGAVK